MSLKRDEVLRRLSDPRSRQDRGHTLLGKRTVAPLKPDVDAIANCYEGAFGTTSESSSDSSVWNEETTSDIVKLSAFALSFLLNGKE